MPLIETPDTVQTQKISISLEPAQNALRSLMMLFKQDQLHAYGGWVEQTIQALSPEEHHDLQLVVIGFHFAITPHRSWPSFPAFLGYLASVEPVVLRDRLMNAYASMPPCAEGGGLTSTPEAVSTDWRPALESPESYLAFLRQRFDEQHVIEPLEREAYRYVIDPPAMHSFILKTLRHVWIKYLGPEWERSLPALRESLRAFRKTDLSHMTRLQAVEFAAGRLVDEDKWGPVLDQAERIVLVPNPHSGPYLGYSSSGGVAWVYFGARLPDGVQADSPELSRAEILVRLSAMADENRLRILKLAADRGELRSQEIIADLNLSQSMASRHLSQLSAAGFLSERRCDGSKCYALNAARVDETLKAVADYLSLAPVK